jgi:carboxymethylenebutenolidase
MRQEIIDLYDQFTHEGLDRRLFMARLSQLAGSTAAAAALVPLLQANSAKAAIVPPDDPKVTTQQESIPASGGEVKGYLAMPAGAAGKLPGVVVIHENRGLNPHIEDVTRRLALEGFVALAPDLLSPMGGTPTDEDKARDMIGQLKQSDAVAEAVAAIHWLEARPESNGKVGIVGFCWGGAVVNATATKAPDLKAAVAYYGMAPDLAAVPNIKAAMMLHYAGLDTRTNATMPPYEKAMDAAGVSYQAFVYEGANHAFNNNTSEARYDPKAAKLAWERTVAFLHKELG